MSYDIGRPRLKLEPLEMLMGAMHHWVMLQGKIGRHIQVLEQIAISSFIITLHQYLINDTIFTMYFSHFRDQIT